MQHSNERHQGLLFFLVVLIILFLAFLASGSHDPNAVPYKQQHPKDASSKIPYRFTQPQPSPDPVGGLTWGQECGKYGDTKDLLNCQEKEGYGYCAKGLRCRQTGRRLGNKCLCL